MAGKESAYSHLSKEDLVRILDHIPQKNLQTAMLYSKVLDSREKEPKNILEDQYRVYYKERQAKANPPHTVDHPLPDHKIEWYMEAVDLVHRVVSVVPGQEINERDLEEIFKISGLFDKHFVDPTVQRLYDDHRNWKSENGYEDNILDRYVGPRNLQRLVIEDSKFSRHDFDTILARMTFFGHIEKNFGIPSTVRLK